MSGQGNARRISDNPEPFVSGFVGRCPKGGFQRFAASSEPLSQPLEGGGGGRRGTQSPDGHSQISRLE